MHAQTLVRFVLALALECLALGAGVPAQSRPAAGPAPYWPRRHEWEKRAPSAVGMDADKLAAAIRFAQENYDNRGGFDASTEPYPEILGPIKQPSGMNGIVLCHGFIAAEWGDTLAADMTFSITKTYLSTVAGLAFDRELFRDVHDPVRLSTSEGYEAAHNREITWHQLLNQTSGWEGTLWDKPDWSDRYRDKRRPPDEPGKHWRYNDVRVNQLAFSLLQVWREPLPQVLRELVLDPIGCSPTWRWHGYRNSWVPIDGLQMQSVSGGGHWGGGMFIATRDQARFGLLLLRDGVWDGKQILSKRWLELARTPTEQMPTYGYMNWFLNTEKAKHSRSAPAGNIFFVGAGTNLIWLDPSHDMVVVVRWLDTRRVDDFIARVLAAFEAGGAGH